MSLQERAIDFILYPATKFNISITGNKNITHQYIQDTTVAFIFRKKKLSFFTFLKKTNFQCNTLKGCFRPLLGCSHFYWGSP